MLLICDQTVDAVQCDPAVVADNPAAAVSIRQTGDDMAGTAGPHLRGIGVKHARVVSFAVNRKEINNFRIDFIAVVRAGFLRHADAAVRLQGTLEWFVSLEADDLFQILIQITRAVGSDRRDDLGIHIQDAAGFALLAAQLHDLIPQFQRGFRRPRQK